MKILVDLPKLGLKAVLLRVEPSPSALIDIIMAERTTPLAMELRSSNHMMLVLNLNGSVPISNLMSSSSNLQPENADDAEVAEDVSVPTLSSYFIKFKAKISKLIDIFRSLSSSPRATKAPSSIVQKNLSY